MGLEIAYAGSEEQGESDIQFVKLIGSKTGHELERLSLTAPHDSSEAGFDILGWSRSGQYLMLARTSPATEAEGGSNTNYLRWNIGANPPAAAIVPLDSLLPEGAKASFAIYPYLKTRDVFQIGSHRFVYQLPGSASLTKIESPAETAQGLIDLPCARVVLYTDGHVKSFPKPEAAPKGPTKSPA